MFTENLQKKESVYERHDVEGTPFTIMSDIANGTHKITIGNNLMDMVEYTSIEDAKKIIMDKDWTLLMNTIALMCINIFNDLSTKTNKNND